MFIDSDRDKFIPRIITLIEPVAVTVWLNYVPLKRLTGNRTRHDGQLLLAREVVANVVIVDDTMFAGIRILHQDGDGNRSTRARPEDFAAFLT